MNTRLLLALQCPVLVADPSATDSGLQPGYWAWAVVGLIVLAFEIWAFATGHHTMSEAVRRGPLWFRWLVGGGLIALLVHLFWWHR